MTLYEYDRNGNVVRIIDAYNNATTLTYDSMNRVASMTDALGAVTRYTYTATGEVATVTDALGGVKTYVYDLLGRLVKETDELGRSTEYTYDALGRALSVKNPLGHSDTFTYDALGRITTVTDKNGNVTKYIYDANGNIIETIDAMGHSAYFAYDAMNRLIKVTLNRTDAKYGVETQQMPVYQYDKKGNITGVTMQDIDIPTVESTYSETQITLYTYDHRGLVTKEINAAGNQTLYVYDGNGNLTQKTDADGYVTEFAYDPRNLVDAINYADGKEVLFAYNAGGELVAMMDWNGVTSFELDLLGRITAVNDHKGDNTAYTYDAVSNQTSITYPDGTVASYQYDLLGRMTTLTDAESQNTVYAYDAASQLISQAYPNGWKETYAYDAAGQLLRQYAEHPDNKTNHSIEHLYTYDPQGNILNEFRSGAGGQARYNLDHTYDALNRMTSTTGDQGYKNQTYTYDSLGNLVHEQIHNKGTEYKYNKLNQQVQKIEDGKDTYNYSFDKRGNLVKGIYEKKNEIVEQYTYDATNRMVLGINAEGEESHYVFNGLGYLVANEWIIANNAYGYHGFAYKPTEQVQGVVVCDAHKNTSGQGHQNPTGAGHFKDKGKTNDGERTTGGTSGGILPKGSNKVMSVHKDYTLDYTSPLKDVIMEVEHGSGGLTYRYTYGLQKVSTVISNVPNGAGELLQNGKVKLYYHHDRLGSTDFLTDNVKSKVTSYVEYDSWGALLSKAIVKLNQRELDLVQEYTGHPYDQVLGLYFAEARMYDAVDRRFVSMDLVKGSVIHPLSLTRYLYCEDNPVAFFDPTGLVKINGKKINTAITGKDIDGSNETFLSINEALELYHSLTSGKSDWIPSPPKSYYESTTPSSKLVKYANYLEYVNKTTTIGQKIQINAYKVKGTYFVKLSCLVNLLNSTDFGGKANLTETNVMFRSTDWTIGKGRSNATMYADNLLNNETYNLTLWEKFWSQKHYKQSYKYAKYSTTLRSSAKEYTNTFYSDADKYSKLLGNGGLAADAMMFAGEMNLPDPRLTAAAAIAYYGWNKFWGQYGTDGQPSVELLGETIGAGIDNVRNDNLWKSATEAISRYIYAESTDYKYLLEDMYARGHFNDALSTQKEAEQAAFGILHVFATDYLDEYERRTNEIISMNANFAKNTKALDNFDLTDYYSLDIIANEMAKILNATNSQLIWGTW